MPDGTIDIIRLLKKETVTLRYLNCKQHISLSNTPDSGSIKFALGAEITSSIAYNATAATIKAAFEALTAISEVEITGSWASKYWDIEFKGIQLGQDVSKLTVNTSTLKISTTAITTTISFLGRGRDATGTYLEGIASDYTIYACIQPLNGRDYELLPEADREKEALEIYTKDEIKEDMLLIRNAKTYEINSIEEWYGYYYAWLIKRVT